MKDIASYHYIPLCWYDGCGFMDRIGENVSLGFFGEGGWEGGAPL